MKRGAVEKKRNSFSIDSIIASNRNTETRCGSPAPRFDTRTYGVPAQLPLHPRSIPSDSRLSDPSLPARTATVAGMMYDEREVMRQRSLFDYARYPNYDNAVAQFAAAAAAMATMTSCPGAMDTSPRAVADPLSYTYWMHASRQQTSSALFLPGKHNSNHLSPFQLFFRFPHFILDVHVLMPFIASEVTTYYTWRDRNLYIIITTTILVVRKCNHSV